MTKQEIKDKSVAFQKLVNEHLQIISNAQDKFDSEVDLDVDENLEFLQDLVDTDEDMLELHNKYNELLDKIDF